MLAMYKMFTALLHKMKRLHKLLFYYLYNTGPINQGSDFVLFNINGVRLVFMILNFIVSKRQFHKLKSIEIIENKVIKLSGCKVYCTILKRESVQLLEC